MDTARYVLAVMVLVTTPIAVGLCVRDHPFCEALAPNPDRSGATAFSLCPPWRWAGRLWRARDTLLGPTSVGTRRFWH